MVDLVFVFLFGLVWGSFLNVVAYRMIQDESLWGWSACPLCKTFLSPIELIPVISWVALGGRCAHCGGGISLLYPLIEVIAAVVFCVIYFLIPVSFWIFYGIVVSALLVIIRSDAEFFLISRYSTLYVIPVGFLGAWMHALPISFFSSVVGTVFGYGFLWFMRRFFIWLRGYEGMGQGDLDCLAMIGAFVGPMGCWFVLIVASVFGAVVGLVLMLMGAGRNDETTGQTILPFGVFLSFAALAVLFLQAWDPYFYRMFLDGAVFM